MQYSNILTVDNILEEYFESIEITALSPLKDLSHLSDFR